MFVRILPTPLLPVADLPRRASPLFDINPCGAAKIMVLYRIVHFRQYAG